MTNWEEPVIVSTPSVRRQEVCSAFEALAIMTEGWPDMTGKHFIRARISCRASLEDRATPDEARQEFAKAAQEAARLRH